MDIVLASASPRRRELLTMLGVQDFRVIPASGDETTPDAPGDEAVRTLALYKAREVAEKCRPDDLIIAADTLVYLDGEALGKPRDKAEAAEMLRRLSGRWHTVYTGVAIIRGGDVRAQTEAAEVYFRALGGDEIDAYIETGEPMDKAGAYGAQGRGAMFIERIEGDFFCVMGLPLCRLTTMLRDMGVSLI